MFRRGFFAACTAAIGAVLGGKPRRAFTLDVGRGLVVFDRPLRLEPVALDDDGKVKPIREVSYMLRHGILPAKIVAKA